MWDRILTPPEQAAEELPVVVSPPPVPTRPGFVGFVERMIPRFSLLTLLLLMVLIALAAAFVAMKLSLEQELRLQQDNSIRVIHEQRQDYENRINLTRADLEILTSIAHTPNLAAEGWLQVRNSNEPNGLYDIVLTLERTINYAVHWQLLGKDGREIQKQAGTIKRFDSPHPSRQVLLLRFTRGSFSQASGFKSPDVFEDTLSCQPVLFTYRAQGSGSNLQTRPLTSRLKTPKIKVVQSQGESNLRQCFTKEHSFLHKHQLKLFEVTGWSQELLEDLTLVITLEELGDADLIELQKTLTFGQ